MISFYMKVISFDVGIKNMAYCIFSIDSSNHTFHIDNWDILNLLETTQQQQQTCTMIDCKKTAKYTNKQNGFYCDKHAKKTNLLPIEECSPSFLKKQTIEEIQKIQQRHYPTFTLGEWKPTKKNWIEQMTILYENKGFLQPIVKKKEKTSNDTDLITIGKNMKSRLNQIIGIHDITHVLIENQISPIANRMKTIQGMLAQYFIMIHEHSDIYIEFISSANKLKGFVLPEEPAQQPEEPAQQPEEQKTTTNYKKNKKNGIFICSQIIQQNEILQSWSSILNTPKKDDLADCFLQGIWYLQNKKLISFADNLKINSIN
jgi:hypothetical protein